MIGKLVWNATIFLVDGLIHLIALFLSRILSHPLMQDAGANIIVAGAKKLCLEDDLDEHFQALSETLKQHMERDAQQAGHDFPKVLGSFVKGMIIKPQPIPRQHKGNNNNAAICSSSTTANHHHHRDDASTSTAGPTSPPSIVIAATSSDDDEASIDTAATPRARRSLLSLPDLRGSKKVQ